MVYRVAKELRRERMGYHSADASFLERKDCVVMAWPVAEELAGEQNVARLNVAPKLRIN